MLSLATNYAVYEIDVVYSNSVNWNFDTSYTSTVPSNKFDFFTVVEHEMGHAVLQGHNSLSTELMYYALDSGEKRAGVTTEAADGGYNVVSTSIGHIFGCGLTHMTSTTSYCTSTGINDFGIVPEKTLLYESVNLTV